MTSDSLAKPAQPYGPDFSAIYAEKWDVWSRAVWPMMKPIISKARRNDRAWLDLCCGTGSLLQLAAREGYDVVGVDRSASQLEHAAKKAPEAELIETDILGLSLPKKFDVISCIFDSLNYLTSLSELERAFGVVRKHLRPDGVFLFDLKTPEGFRNESGRVYNAADQVVIFERSFDEDEALHLFHVTGFVADGNRYRRFEETHRQRGYDTTLVAENLTKLGFDVVCRDFETGKKATAKSRRVFCVATRP